MFAKQIYITVVYLGVESKRLWWIIIKNWLHWLAFWEVYLHVLTTTAYLPSTVRYILLNVTNAMFSPNPTAAQSLPDMFMQLKCIDLKFNFNILKCQSVRNHDNQLFCYYSWNYYDSFLYTTYMKRNKFIMCHRHHLSNKPINCSWTLLYTSYHCGLMK